jgi:hypothetical protein
VDHANDNTAKPSLQQIESGSATCTGKKWMQPHMRSHRIPATIGNALVAFLGDAL